MASLRSRLTLAVIAAATAGLILSGCSGDGGAPSTETTSAEAAILPDEQQNLTVVPNYGIQALDMSKAPLEIGMNQVMVNVMQPLVRTVNGEVEGVLAESWEWVDETTLVFTLREGVTFSDGTPFTAADVVGSLDRYIAQKQALAAPLSIITDYVATDDATVTIHTSAPTGTLVGILSMIYVGQAAHATDDAWWAKPIGTGPFVIEDYVADDHVTLTRNDDYWGEKAKLKTLTFKIMTDINARVTGLANDEVQVVSGIPYDQIESVKALDGVTFTDASSLSYWFLWFENSHAPLDDVKVRTAMWKALDMPTIIAGLYGDTVSEMKSYCPSAAFGCLDTSDFPSYDPEGAKKLLAEAGLADGFSTDIIFSTASAGTINLVQAMVSAWKEIGVTVEVRGEDAATWLADFNAHNWDMDVQANQTITGDADYTLNRLYSCKAARLGYCNEDLDALMTQAQQSTDADERLKLYQQVVDMMAADVPGIPLFQITSNVAMRSNVQGLVIPPTEFVEYSSVYLTE